MASDTTNTQANSPSNSNTAGTAQTGKQTGDQSGNQSGKATRSWQDVNTANKRTDVPEGLWMRCPECEAMSYRKQVEQNMHVCPDCDHHYRIGADERIAQLCDPGSFEPLWEELSPRNALGFVDRKRYKDRLLHEQSKTGHRDAVRCGKAFIKGRGVILTAMDNRFMMASMGSVVGEKIARAAELAVDLDRPLIIVSTSGGARMQESSLSLSQMAKVSAALARLDDAGGLFISVLTDPTTGGVTASFAMLGDVILAEPRAYIGFAGARVIANTVRQELPKGFQRARAPARQRLCRSRRPPPGLAQRNQPIY